MCRSNFRPIHYKDLSSRNWIDTVYELWLDRLCETAHTLWLHRNPTKQIRCESNPQLACTFVWKRLLNAIHLSEKLSTFRMAHTVYRTDCSRYSTNGILQSMAITLELRGQFIVWIALNLGWTQHILCQRVCVPTFWNVRRRRRNREKKIKSKSRLHHFVSRWNSLSSESSAGKSSRKVQQYSGDHQELLRINQLITTSDFHWLTHGSDRC